jgi:hypothetical protein
MDADAVVAVFIDAVVDLVDRRHSTGDEMPEPTDRPA